MALMVGPGSREGASRKAGCSRAPDALPKGGPFVRPPARWADPISGQADPLSAHERLGTARRTELGQDVADVPFRRAERDGQAGRDIRVARALGHQAQDVELARGERLDKLPIGVFAQPGSADRKSTRLNS